MRQRRLFWGLCDGNRTVSEIAIEVGIQTNSKVDEDFVWLALDQMYKDGLLTGDAGRKDRWDRLTRRDLIRKIGITSTIALPLVSAIVAPKAVAAQSSCSVAVNDCLTAGSNFCPPGCVGLTLDVTIFNSINGTCSMGVAANSTFLCSALPQAFFSDGRVNTIT